MKLDFKLENRLLECNLTVNDIINRITIDNDCNTAVILYTSFIENLGNSQSDFDIYIIKDIKSKNNIISNKDKPSSEFIKLGEAILDIEHWNLYQIDNILDDLQNKKDIDYANFLHRIMVGVPILGENLANSLKEKIKKTNLQEYLKMKFIFSTNAEFDDAVRFYKANDYLSAFVCARKSLDKAICAFNFSNNITNGKEKWGPKIFLNNKAFENYDILERYLNCQIYLNVTNENINNVVESQLELIQDILMRIAIS